MMTFFWIIWWQLTQAQNWKCHDPLGPQAVIVPHQWYLWVRPTPSTTITWRKFYAMQRLMLQGLKHLDVQHVYNYGFKFNDWTSEIMLTLLGMCFQFRGAKIKLVELGLLGLWIRSTNTNTKQRHRRRKKYSHWQRSRGHSHLCRGPRSSGRTSESLGHAAPQLWLAPQFCTCPAPSLFQTHTHTHIDRLSMLLFK